MSGPFEPVRWNACVHRLDLGIYSLPKEVFGSGGGGGGRGGVRTHVNSKRKIPSTENFSSEEDRTHDAASRSDSEPNTLPTELFWPQHP